MRALGSLENGPAFAPQGRPGRLNGADPGLRAQVAGWRARGMSWDGVGRCLGRSGADARAAFDAVYLRVVAPAPIPTISVTSPKRSAAPPIPLPESGVVLGPLDMEVVCILARRGRLPGDLAKIQGVAGGTMRNRLLRLREAGLVGRKANGCWSVTSAGRDAVAGEGA